MCLRACVAARSGQMVPAMYGRLAESGVSSQEPASNLNRSRCQRRTLKIQTRAKAQKKLVTASLCWTSEKKPGDKIPGPNPVHDEQKRTHPTREHESEQTLQLEVFLFESSSL